MKIRVITGAIMAVTIIPIFVIGSWPLLILLGLFTLMATYEIYHLAYRDAPDYIALGTNLAFGLGMYISLVMYLKGDIGIVTPLSTIILSGLVYIYYYAGLRQSMKLNLMASLYPSIGFATLYAFRDASLALVGYVFLITIATDVFAYFVGINFGKHKLAPTISPKKSIEGSIGGTSIALVLTIIYILVADIDMILSIETSFFVLLVLTILISVLGQIGDLVASYVKRQYETKDFSNLFPGHGGVMDRFDSVLFVGIVILLISEVVKLV
jgi:phosphatidate cytidylyltransferase